MANLKVEVTVLKPDSHGRRAARWAVLDDSKVVKSAEVSDDPKGVKAADQGRRYIKMAVEAAGGSIELEAIPAVVSEQVA